MDQGKKIRVLFITKWFMNRHDPQLGVFIRKHASAAAKYCDVALLYTAGDSDQAKKFDAEEKHEHGFKSTTVYFRTYSSVFPLLNKLVNMFRYLHAMRIGLRKVRMDWGKQDITHAYIMLRPAGIAWYLKFTRKIPYVISEQWSGYATGAFQKKNFVVKWISRFLFKKADAVSAVSPFLKNKMMECGLHHLFHITPNVIEPQEKKLSPLPSTGQMKMLVVADLVDDIKNISDVIRITDRLLKTGKQVELHIIGHGRDEAMLKALAAGSGLLDRSVFFHGVKTNEEVFQYLHACDFLVMNSRFETFSLVCIEAMSCGKPVIATRCGGPVDFVNETNGILIEPGNAEALFNAAIQMLESFNSYDPESIKAQVSGTYSSRTVGQKFLEIYQEVLQK